MLDRSHATAAAAQIVTMINSMPRTPSVAEIASVIAGAMPSAYANASPLTLELRRIRLLYHAAVAAELDAEEDTPAYAAACAKTHRLEEEFEALAQRVRHQPAEGMNDVVRRAEVALFYGAGALEDLYSDCPHARAQAAVLAAITVLGGCPIHPLDAHTSRVARESCVEHDVGWLARTLRFTDVPVR